MTNQNFIRCYDQPRWNINNPNSKEGSTCCTPTVESLLIDCPPTCTVANLAAPAGGTVDSACADGATLADGSSCALACGAGLFAAGTQLSCTGDVFNAGSVTCEACSSQTGCEMDGTTCSTASELGGKLVCAAAGASAHYSIDAAGTATPCAVDTFSEAGEDSTTGCDVCNDGVTPCPAPPPAVLRSRSAVAAAAAAAAADEDSGSAGAVVAIILVIIFTGGMIWCWWSGYFLALLAKLKSTAGCAQGDTFVAFDFSSGAENLVYTIDGGTETTVSVNANCDTNENCATALTSAILDATVSVVDGYIRLTSDTTGDKSSFTTNLVSSGSNMQACFGTVTEVSGSGGLSKKSSPTLRVALAKEDELQMDDVKTPTAPADNP